MASRKLIARPPLTATAFSKHDPKRFNKIQLYEHTSNINNNDETSNNFKYELTILDRDIKIKQHSNDANILPCAVFLIPAGRESEYIFRTKNGLLSVAESANCVRLIAVSFNRNHLYINQEFVQQELERSVQLIAQRGEFWKGHRNNDDIDTNFQIPFLAVDGIGKRNVIAEGDTPTTGPFLVEEVKDPDGEENCFVRRLYFLSNPNVIQSETFVKKDGITEEFQKTRLAFDYQKHLSAGMVGLGFCNEISSSAVEGQRNILVIGVGGGGLINFLHCLLPKTKISAIELDGNIVEIAKAHFGFDTDEDATEVILGDGLNVHPDLNLEKGLEQSSDNNEGKITFPASSFTGIAIDVDSKDTSCGMSCPPVSFVDIAYLQQLKNLLSEEGVLAINVSARDPAMLKLVKRNVLDVFSSVFVSSNTSEEDNDDLNVVVFAKKRCSSLPSDSVELQKIIDSFCNENEIHDNSLQSQLKECLVGVKEIKVEDIAPTDNDEKGLPKKTSNKKSNKKKGSSKKKKGKKK